MLSDPVAEAFGLIHCHPSGENFCSELKKRLFHDFETFLCDLSRSTSDAVQNMKLIKQQEHAFFKNSIFEGFRKLMTS